MEANVVYNEEHDCYLLEFDEDTMKELGWEVGDQLVWCFDGENVSLRKYMADTPRDSALRKLNEGK